MLEARRELGKLEARFPGFKFSITKPYGKDGKRRIEAVRKSGPGDSGLFVIISTSPAEVAEELKRAA